MNDIAYGVPVAAYLTLPDKTQQVHGQGGFDGFDPTPLSRNWEALHKNNQKCPHQMPCSLFKLEMHTKCAYRWGFTWTSPGDLEHSPEPLAGLMTGCKGRN